MLAGATDGPVPIPGLCRVKGRDVDLGNDPPVRVPVGDLEAPRSLRDVVYLWPSPWVEHRSACRLDGTTKGARENKLRLEPGQRRFGRTPSGASSDVLMITKREHCAAAPAPSPAMSQLKGYLSTVTSRRPQTPSAAWRFWASPIPTDASLPGERATRGAAPSGRSRRRPPTVTTPPRRDQPGADLSPRPLSG